MRTLRKVRSGSGRNVLVAGILLTLGTLSISAVYLPFFSDIEKKRTESLPDDFTKNIETNRSNSMWKNAQEFAKGSNEK